MGGSPYSTYFTPLNGKHFGQYDTPPGDGMDRLSRVLSAVTEPVNVGEIKGVGEGLAKKIAELVQTGKLAYYDELNASIPPGLVAMLDIPGLGPKRILTLQKELGIESVEALEQACKTGKVAQLAGFGEKSQTNLLEGIQRRRLYATKHLLSDALRLAEPILDGLRRYPDVIRCSVAGSLRRWKEVIGDVDFLASSKKPAEIIEFFTSQPGIIDVSAKGDTKASVVLEGGIQADLRVVSDTEYPFALAYFTGGAMLEKLGQTTL